MLPALWFRIHADIGDYLIQRGANGVPVVYWYHRQFIEVRFSYLSHPFNPQNVSTKKLTLLQ